MKTKDLIKRIEELFRQKLQVKTSWGRNEILASYKDSVKEALLELTEQYIKDDSHEGN